MKLLLITLLVAYAAADVSHLVGNPAQNAKIVKQELNVGVEGQYQWAIETENGIFASEQGALKNPQSENAAEVVEGSARWTAPNGEVVEIAYVADENGYHPRGTHLPTPPPIPEAIAQSIEYIRAHPPPPSA